MARRAARRRSTGKAGLLLVALLVAAVSLILFSRVFVLKQVSLIGDAQVSVEGIMHRAGLTLGTSMFFIDEAKVTDAFAEEGYVKLLSCEKQWPDTLTFEFANRVPVGAVEYLGMYYIVDENCEVIEQRKALPDDMPVVTGTNGVVCQVGAKMTSGKAGQIGAMAQVLQAIKTQDASAMISELNVSDLDNLYLMTRAGMMVVLGDADNMADKLAWMKSALSSLEAEGKTTGRLDVTSGKLAVYSG